MDVSGSSNLLAFKVYLFNGQGVGQGVTNTFPKSGYTP